MNEKICPLLASIPNPYCRGAHCSWWCENDVSVGGGACAVVFLGNGIGGIMDELEGIGGKMYGRNKADGIN